MGQSGKDSKIDIPEGSLKETSSPSSKPEETILPSTGEARTQTGGIRRQKQLQ